MKSLTMALAALGFCLHARTAQAQGARAPYLQMGTNTGVTVVWRTTSNSNSQVCYGTAPNALNQSASVAGQRTHHEVRIAGLTPGSRTYYAVASACPPAGSGDPESYYDASPTVGSRPTW